MYSKKIIKGILFCLSVYGYGELMYQVGKGKMLGVLSHYSGISLDEVKSILSDEQEKYPINLILGMCKITEEAMEKKES